jgi:hypothetical protein
MTYHGDRLQPMNWDWYVKALERLGKDINQQSAFGRMRPQMYQSKSNRARYLKLKITDLERQLQDVENEPDEPSGVITFTKSFGKNYPVYSYAAIYIPALKKWCVTGPRNPQYVTWDELYAFIQRDEDGYNEIFEAAEWSIVQ